MGNLNESHQGNNKIICMEFQNSGVSFKQTFVFYFFFPLEITMMFKNSRFLLGKSFAALSQVPTGMFAIVCGHSGCNLRRDYFRSNVALNMLL